MMKTIATDDIQSAIGYQGEPSPWFKIDQSRINSFADATLDHQFIHVNPEKAKETPFGGTIAHGLLSLSLLPYFAEHFAIKIEGAEIALNYGFDRVRFISPVKVGSEVRALSRIVDVYEKSPGQVIIKFDVTIEIKGEEKPALVVEWLTMQVLS
ncbi:MAG: MaoC family dehydratase [Gammaproteobacteria bacterium]